MREAALAGVLTDQHDSGTANEVRASAAVALAATPDDADVLTAGERALLRELLVRLSERATAPRTD